MRVASLGKPANRWCVYARKGRGCGNYDARPQQCRDFDCAWVLGKLPLELSPMATHAVVTGTTDGQHLVIHEDAGYPGRGREALREVINLFTADGTRYVVVVCGDRRTFYGNPALLPPELRQP